MPRILATVLLLGSLAMLAPLGLAVAGLLHGRPVASTAVAIPLIFLATGCALTWLLARKVFPLQLFVVAFSLWILAAAYYFLTFFV